MENIYLNNELFSVLERQALSMKKDLKGFFGGKNLTNSYGQTVEFADYREYCMGDDIRRIDWNLYSRFEKHYLKLFTDERQMQVEVYLDCSASMGKGNSLKSQYAKALAASLGYLAVHNMDKVSFKFIKEGALDDSMGSISTKKAFFSKLSYISDYNFDGESFMSEAILSKQMKGKKSGMSIIISDFLGYNDWEKAVDYLSFKGNQVLLIQLLNDDEIAPNYVGRMNLIDAESASLLDDKNIKMKITGTDIKAYDKAYREMKNKISKFCKSRGISYVTLATSTQISKALFYELMKVGVMS